jgi:hypothetical protein
MRAQVCAGLRAARSRRSGQGHRPQQGALLTAIDADRYGYVPNVVYPAAR